jgi:hypothetical protein
MHEQLEQLRDALWKLRNEATGFLSMADQERHGVTNMRVLKLRIDEATHALERSGGDPSHV